jgi:hypothetical protein
MVFVRACERASSAALDQAQAEDVRALAAAVVPPVAAGLTIQCRLQLPDRGVRWVLQGSQRYQREPVAPVALGLQQVVTAVDRLADGRLRLRLAGRGHRGAASPHDRIPGFAFQSVSFTEFGLGGAANQDRLPVLAGVDAVHVPDTLGLRLTVAAGQRDVDYARAYGPERLSAFPDAGKPLQIAAGRVIGR